MGASVAIGDALGNSGRGSKSTARSAQEFADARAGGQTPEAANDQQGGGYPEPVVEGKWPRWLVTLLVIAFCTGAWAGIYYFGKAVIDLLR